MAKFKADGKMIFIIFIGAIIALALIVNIADQVVNSTALTTTTNFSTTSAQVNQTITLPGRANTTVITVWEGTGVLDISENFTINDTVNANGVLGIFLFTSDAAGLIGQNVSAINVTYTAEPQGYVKEASSRSVVALILIFSALAITVFVIVTLWGSGALKNILGMKN